MAARPLRLMIYDRTCWGGVVPGLTPSWMVGGALFRAIGALDAARGVASWDQGLQWLAEHEPERPIEEIQYWGHGRFGCALVAGERLDEGSLSEGHPHRPLLERLRPRMLPEDQSLWWFRTCETFGTVRGHQFAQAWTAFFEARAAGHTFVIGPWQSGLHVLSPGQRPDWPVDEGLLLGQREPPRARWSSPLAPHTISCLRPRLPALHLGT
jgi:hypothetical protein